MGECNISLVPAAILYANPGLNRDEFITLLNKVKNDASSNTAVADFDDPLHLGLGSPSFHGGIFELANILRLKCNLVESFLVNYYALEFLNERPEKSKLGKLLIKPTKGKNKWISPRYFIQTDIKERHISEKTNQQKFFFKEPSVGNIFNDFNHNYFRIRKIHDVKHEIENKQDKFITNIDHEVFKYLPVFDKFNSLDKLITKYPEYDPVVCIDWEQFEGKICPPNYRSNENVIWEKINEGYYLKKDLLQESDYTGIVITAEAIRKKQWGLFQFHGYCLTQKFLVENEDSAHVHQRAVIDYQLSQYAKANNMSNSDLLRYRLEHGLNNVKHQRLSDKVAFHIVYQEAKNGHGLLDTPYTPTVKEILKNVKEEKEMHF